MMNKAERWKLAKYDNERLTSTQAVDNDSLYKQQETDKDSANIMKKEREF